MKLLITTKIPMLGLLAAFGFVGCASNDKSADDADEAAEHLHHEHIHGPGPHTHRETYYYERPGPAAGVGVDTPDATKPLRDATGTLP